MTEKKDEDSFIQVEENENAYNNNDENDSYANNTKHINGNAINTEFIFKNQKQKIEQTKQKQNILKSKGKPHPKKIFNGTLACLTLKDFTFWETTQFDYEVSQDDNEEIPKTDKKWETNNNLIELSKGKLNSFEISKIALRTINEIDYDQNGVELNISLNLKGGSQFWIFTRCFINKDVNESGCFDTQSQHNEPGDIFNKYSSVIKISKEDKSTKCFISFCTFYEDENGSMYLKTFFKRQLIDYSEKKNKFYYLENDSCDFNILLVDVGTEVISTKISVNGSEKRNDVNANFYIPTNKRSKIMFGGIGQSVELKSLFLNSFHKDDNIGTMFTSERKSCNCCYIF